MPYAQSQRPDGSWGPAKAIKPPIDVRVRQWWRQRGKPKHTEDRIRAVLIENLPHWMPNGGEAGDTPDQRYATARYAANVIVDRIASYVGPEVPRG